MKKLTWTTVQRKVKDLLPYKQNPRKISEKTISDLKKSIQKYNLVEIPAIDLDNKILAGHQRLAVMQLLGRGDEVIDCRYPNRKLTDEEYKQYLIASNKISGDWDENILYEYFDTDLLLDSGFDKEELTDLFEDIVDTEDDNFSVKKELEKIGKPKSKLGDLYQLGPHRLLCGNSENLDDVKRVVGDEKIDLICNDPIYNISYNYKSGMSKTRNYGGSVNDSKSDEDYYKFIKNLVVNSLAVSKKDVHCFFFSDQKYASMVQKIYDEVGIKFQRTCIWLKLVSNPTPQIAFSKIYEPITYGIRGKPFLNNQYYNFNEILNKEITNGHCVSEEFLDLIDVWMIPKLSGSKMDHPTEKNIEIYHKPFKRCSKINDNILDLCGGSGASLIAAHQLKRKCFMVEIDPVFVDLIIKRFESATGIKAIKI